MTGDIYRTAIGLLGIIEEEALYQGKLSFEVELDFFEDYYSENHVKLALEYLKAAGMIEIGYTPKKCNITLFADGIRLLADANLSMARED